MFTGPKYITQWVKAEIPAFLQHILWYMIETMDISEKDYLQVFRLNQASEEDMIKQRIVHTQEEPPFQQEFIIQTQQVVTAKILSSMINPIVRCCFPMSINGISNRN